MAFMFSGAISANPDTSKWDVGVDSSPNGLNLLIDL